MNGKDTFLTLHVDKDTPDGGAMDISGTLWIAIWSGRKFTNLNLDCKESIAIMLTTPNVSSCSFGRERIDLLLITTARESMSDSDIEKYTLSGRIFVTQAGVKSANIHDFQINM